MASTGTGTLGGVLGRDILFSQTMSLALSPRRSINWYQPREGGGGVLDPCLSTGVTLRV